MEKSKTILLGIKNNAIITADLTLTNRNGYTEFTARFNEGLVFDINDIDDDYKKNYYNDMWDCYSAEQKLEFLDDGEKTKYDVFADWKYDSEYKDIKDCSCTDYEMEINGKEINFETLSCGQYDVRNDEDFKNMIFTDKQLFNLIMYYWDNYHMKEVNEEQIQVIEGIMRSNYEENSELFDQFIKDHINI